MRKLKLVDNDEVIGEVIVPNPPPWLNSSVMTYEDLSNYDLWMIAIDYPNNVVEATIARRNLKVKVQMALNIAKERLEFFKWLRLVNDVLIPKVQSIDDSVVLYYEKSYLAMSLRSQPFELSNALVRMHFDEKTFASFLSALKVYEIRLGHRLLYDEIPADFLRVINSLEKIKITVSSEFTESLLHTLEYAGYINGFDNFLHSLYDILRHKRVSEAIFAEVSRERFINTMLDGLFLRGLTPEQQELAIKIAALASRE